MNFIQLSISKILFSIVIICLSFDIFCQNNIEESISNESENQEPLQKINDLTILGKKELSENLDSSRNHFFNALTIAFEINNVEAIANISRYIGNVYWTESQYELAFQYYFDALGYYEVLNDTLGIALSLNNIGEVYKKQSDYITSLEYLRKSLEYKLKLSANPYLSYYNIGEIHYFNSDLDSAKYYFDIILEQASPVTNQLELSYAHSGLGKVYAMTGYPNGAIFHLTSALRYRKSLDEKRLIITSFLDLSEVYSSFRQFETSYTYLDSAYNNLEQLFAKDLLVNYWDVKSKLDFESRNYKNAYISNKKYHQLKDSIFTLDKHYQIEELKTKYYTEKTKRENEALIYDSKLNQNKLNQIKSLATGSTIALLGFVVITIMLAKSQKVIKKQRSQLADRTKTLENTLYDLNSSIEDNQSFSYSVSHDLKGPLRILSYHTKVLIEDLEILNKNEIETALQKVLQNIVKMEIIIHDILDLSLVTQLEVVYQDVDLTDLANQCVYELRQEEPNRDVSIDIASNLKSKGDPGLLKILLKNVIGNSWKYTSKTENAQISFYKSKSGNFCVEDNGAGFDMKYYEQIFKPFKRLHSEEEFEGSGIGLSIVQRIVKKHRGNVFAESEIGVGTKFYFSI